MWREILRMAFGSLGVNKLRSFLTMSGITIGVFSVIGVMTTVSALRHSIESGLSFLGSDTFQISKWPVGITIDRASRRKIRMRRNLTLAEGMRYQELMRGTSDVVCLKVYYRGTEGQASYGGRQTEPGLTICGSNEYFPVANQYTIGSGRNLTPADVEMARPLVIIGQTLVSKLFPSESPLHKRITIARHSYTVIGVFARKGTNFGRDQDDVAVVPITRFLDDFGAKYYSLTFATQAPTQQTYNETLERAITVMRIVRQLRPEDENDFDVYSNDSLIAAFGKVANVVAAGSLIISGIALLAAGVGIMNIMLVSVTERTREIGVRKSIGARKSNILTQFLLESVTLSLAGGLAGILLGVIAGNGLAVMLKASIIFPWLWAAIGVLVCTAIGVGFGLYPAWKAASLDPIEALRYE